MNREKNIKRIAELLAWIESKVKHFNKLHYTDINISSETFFADLLNIIYDYSFINLNEQKINSPYADLHDSKNNIFCQVTSKKTSEKIKDSIKGIESLDTCDSKSKIIILLLSSKPRYSTKFETVKVQFDNNNDILDTLLLIQKISTLDNDRIERVKQYLELNLDAIDGKEKTICNEDETIIDIIDFLTANSTIMHKDIESFIDPDDKINRRFSEYADYLKDEYRDMFSVYGGSIKVAYNNMMNDEVKIKKHNRYLKTISVEALDSADNNPKKALDLLINRMDALISTSGKNYDKNAIRFYLVDQIIQCNVFPNEVH